MVPALGKISFKKNEWLDLILILYNAFNSRENEFKIFAIKTLNIIREFLDFNSIETLKVYKLFLVYIKNKNKFNDNDYLKPTLKMIINLANINNSNLNYNVITTANHIITEIAKIDYDYMGKHIIFVINFLFNGQNEK